MDSAEQDRQIKGAVDAVDRMMSVVDTFEEYVVSTYDRDAHGRKYRLNLLWVHAFAALMMAPLMSLTGRAGLTGPSFAFFRVIPGTPYSLAAVLGTGGLILGMGCIFHAKRIEMTGLVLLALFYLCLAISFTVPGVMWFVGGRHAMKPPLWGPVLYLHLTLIMAMHIRGLIFSRRDDAASARIRQEAREAGQGEFGDS